MGGRDIDDFKKIGHKTEVVSGHINKLLVLGHLTEVISNP